MDSYIIVVIILAILLIVAAALLVVVFLRSGKLRQENSSLLAETVAKQREIEIYCSRLEEERQQAEKTLKEQEAGFQRRIEEINARSEKEKLERTEILDKQFSERLKLLQEQLKTATDELLKQRSEELNKTNRHEMDSIISPLKDVIKDMKKSMDDNRESITRSTSTLGEQIKQMHTTATSLGQEAEKLSKALQAGPKVQGDFGEMKLKDLLDRFGFTQGVEYDLQLTMRDANGQPILNKDTNEKMRPDAVLHYPDNKDIIIDSKASLTAFIGYVNAETDEQRKQFLDDHVKSVRKHIDELSGKGYGNYSISQGTTLEFVIMFVPQEAALQLAISADPTLWSYAFEKNVVITGEQNLYSLLRLLQIAWVQQRQVKNLEKVFELASTLVDRVGLFFERFNKIGNNLETASKSYQEARKSLHGSQSFVATAHKLIGMGAKENKKRPLPEILDYEDSEDLEAKYIE